MEALYYSAIQLLQKVSTPKGFTAAPVQQDNYFRVWTRDAIVCGIACATTNDEKLLHTFQNTLETIWHHQHPSGYLPGNVQPHSGTPGYGGSAGRADNTSWGIIGACLFAHVTGKPDFLFSLQQKIEKAFAVMEAWEYNGKHLLYVPQSGDWADEYIQHGYVLYDQLLRLWALQLAARMFAHEPYAAKAAQVKQAIEANFFYRAGEENWYCTQLARAKETAPKTHWWLGFNPAQLYPHFDLQANMLALLLRIGSPEQQQKTIAAIGDLAAVTSFMLPSFHPTVMPEDPLMGELENNYAYRFRNVPYEFHNGGLWPVWNGWAAGVLYAHNENLYRLLRNRMETALPETAPGFNECMHGLTGLPCGVEECAWSAAGYIIAHNAEAFNKMIAL